MREDRRAILRSIAAASLGGATVAASAADAQHPSVSNDADMHDMSAFPPQWKGTEQIVMLVYPEFTALDLVGPHYMLSSLWGATVKIVAGSKAPVRSDTGLVFVPDLALGDVPRSVDILFVPGGGQGTLAAMQDKRLVRWVADRARRAKLVASVCTGSLVLGQAGLLRGRRATSHWATHGLLREFGAIPVQERVVWDGDLVTGAGVSAGLDLGLAVVAKLRDRAYAQCVQLLAEYAPQPPFDAGLPSTAPKDVQQMTASMFDRLLVEMKQTARQALSGG